MRAEGDQISGEITVAPNARNPRDLDIVIDYKVEGSHPTAERREYRMYVEARDSCSRALSVELTDRRC